MIPRLNITVRHHVRSLPTTVRVQVRYRSHSKYIEKQLKVPPVRQFKGPLPARGNEWIRGGNFVKNDKNFIDQYSSLGDIKDKNCIYLKDEELRSLIDSTQFILNKNALNNSLKYQKYNKVFENYKYLPLMKTALRSFEDKLYHSLINYKDSTDVKLEDVLVPSVENLPNLIRNISSPKIQEYFKTLSIESIPDQIYYFFEQTLHKEYRLLKTNRTPPQNIKVDISNPAEWYPRARKIKRKIIMHVGPTNSGKTYNALKRLKESNNGYFAGPLRLLAREIYDRFKSEGIRCNLITGEEVIEDLDQFGNKATLSSGTVEMIDTNTYYDVVVLDEIQMIADETRGWAWTGALLGVQAKEIHLCGEERAVPLIKEMLKATGDELIVNKYERLGKLKVEDTPLHNQLDDLRKGDCIVVFSKKRILTYKIEIEKSTKLKCGVIYGALPAEVRSTEASKFNNGEYDVLIASDAIGMGLNLKINRVIFDDHRKFDGETMGDIHAAHIKQVGGRAGRFKVAPSKKQDGTNDANEIIKQIEVDLNDNKDTSIGYVSAFTQDTLDYVRRCFDQDIEDIQTATIWPEDEIWSHYISEYPSGTRFSDIMKAFKVEVKATSGIYEAASIKDRVDNVAIFDKVKQMLVIDQLRISNIPLNNRVENFPEVMMNFALQVSRSETKSALDFENMNYQYILGRKYVPTTNELTSLETLHKKLMAWLWMNNRYPTLFVDREGAEDLKTLAEDKIEEALESLRVGKIRRGNKNARPDNNKRTYKRRR